MKQSIRRIALWLCMFACLLSLAACSNGGQEAGEEIDPQAATYICQVSEGLLEEISELPDDELKSMEAELKKQKQYVLSEGVAAWAGVKSDTGALVGIVSSEASLDEDGSYICTVYAQYEKRNMEFKLFLDSQALEPTGISFSPEYTLGENMARAGMNTVMGMGTVFLVLIFLSLLIACFKYVGVLEKKMQEIREAKLHRPGSGGEEEGVWTPPTLSAEPPAPEPEDDLELVAVIAAAVAAAAESEGSSSDGLIVRSIKRVPSARWKRA